jgi:hypothetical protein
MRLSVFVRHLFLFFVIASPALVLAQFRNPSTGELKMTADPKAPGANAVYLNVEEITDDPHHFYSFYARIKVLTEKGKERATVQIPIQVGDTGVQSVKPPLIGQEWTPDPYFGKRGGAAAESSLPSENVFKIDGIKGRVFHSDGTAAPFTFKSDNLLKVKSPDGQFFRLAFTLPGVEVGSILEYSYTIRYDDKHFSSPFWQIQRPYFVHKAHYVFQPFNNFLNDAQSVTSRYLVDTRGKVINTLIWWPVLPSGATVKRDALGNFSLDLNDIPPVPEEEWMPPVQSFAYHVFFYYKNVFSGSEFWTFEDKRWSKEVDRFAAPTDTIRQAVASLTASGDGELEKARKLYKAVQELDNTSFSAFGRPAGLGQSELRFASSADEVWTRKSGSSREIALLYLAMLRAAGLAAYDMKVVNRDKGVFSSGYLSFDQFDDDIVILRIGNDELFLDPGQKMCPFQTVHWKHAGASGIRQIANGVEVAATPLLRFSANSLMRDGDITFDGRASFSGRFRFVITGQEALYWRQFALLNGPDEAKRQFDLRLAATVSQGVQAHLDHFLALDNPDFNLVALVNILGTLDASSPGRCSLPAFIFEAHGNQPFVDEPQRQKPVDMRFASQTSDRLVFHLPSGFAVEKAPRDAKIDWPNYAAVITTTVTEPSQITITRAQIRAFTFALQNQYQDLRAFHQKVAASDQQQLVLAASSVKKDN